jgi:hypothetical protein
MGEAKLLMLEDASLNGNAKIIDVMINAPK